MLCRRERTLNQFVQPAWGVAMEEIARDDGRRFEVLAAVTGIGAAAVFLGLFGQVLAIAWTTSEYSEGGFSWDILFLGASASGNIVPAALLVVSLALVLLSPGPTIGKLGSQVLQGLRMTGTVVGVFALIATEELLRRASAIEVSLTPGVDYLGPSLPLAKQVLLRASTAAPFLAAAVVAGCVAWLSHSTLRDVPLASEPSADGDPADDADEVDGHADLLPMDIE